MPLNYCSKCDAPIDFGAKYCDNCGQAVATNNCSKCNAIIESNAKFCDNCGHRIQAGVEPKLTSSTHEVMPKVPEVAISIAPTEEKSKKSTGYGIALFVGLGLGLAVLMLVFNSGNTRKADKNSISPGIVRIDEETHDFPPKAGSFVFESPPVDVYVAGSENGYATLWKNDIAERLSDAGSHATSVFVSGNDIYVAGFMGRPPRQHPRATLWKNGTVQHLNISGVGSTAHSVFVVGKDVYVAGDEYNTGGDGTAVIWRNGVPERLGRGSVLSVYVSGHDVYAAGMDFNGDGLWKNGVSQQLDGKKTFAQSVVVSGSNVFVAGMANERATFWKNGVAQRISEENFCSLNSVFTFGNDVYIAGTVGNPIYEATTAMLWKNGIAQRLGDGSAWSVFSAEQDIYVAGEQNERATLWINGIPQRLSNLESMARSVFVVSTSNHGISATQKSESEYLADVKRYTERAETIDSRIVTATEELERAESKDENIRAITEVLECAKAAQELYDSFISYLETNKSLGVVGVSTARIDVLLKECKEHESGVLALIKQAEQTLAELSQDEESSLPQ